MSVSIKSSAFLSVEETSASKFEVRINSVWRIQSMKIMAFDMKWVHMARYKLVSKLDVALRLRIISGPYLMQKMLMKGLKTSTNLIKGFHKRLPTRPPRSAGSNRTCVAGSNWTSETLQSVRFNEPIWIYPPLQPVRFNEFCAAIVKMLIWEPGIQLFAER